MNKLKVIFNEPTARQCTASFIFMHGSGGTGKLLHEHIRECGFSFPHMRIVFPTAPKLPYTLLGGVRSNVWFDRKSLEPTGSEDWHSINSMALQLLNIVQAEIDSGIPENRIVIGGFSMGASMALHLGLRFLPSVAAVVSMSTFLYNDSEVYRILENDTSIRRPPLLYCHGDQDDLIYNNWGRRTCDRLTKLGIQTTFKTIPNLGHDINIEELDIIKSWVMERVPDC